MSDLQAVAADRSAPRRQARVSQRGKAKEKGPSKDWTIKGLPTSTVEVARDAARESGMKINAWVTSVFEQAVQEGVPKMEGVRKSFSVSDPHFDEEIERLKLRNEELVQTIKNLSQALAKLSQ